MDSRSIAEPRRNSREHHVVEHEQAALLKVREKLANSHTDDRRVRIRCRVDKWNGDRARASDEPEPMEDLTRVRPRPAECRGTPPVIDAAPVRQGDGGGEVRVDSAWDVRRELRAIQARTHNRAKRRRNELVRRQLTSGGLALCPRGNSLETTGLELVRGDLRAKNREGGQPLPIDAAHEKHVST